MKRVAGVFFAAIGILLFGGRMDTFAKEPEKVRIYDTAKDKIELVPKVEFSDAEWKKRLTPEQYRVTRRGGTEPAFSGQCPVPKKGEAGVYECVCCGTDLFKVQTKYESGTGWPSFWEPVSELNVAERVDETFGMRRTEALCARCDAHLGHVFDDGPPPTGKRYCINSVALKFAKHDPAKKNDPQKAAFAAGCFWGVEAVFAQTKGVAGAVSGYSGGTFKNPAYKDVCSGKTGHAETVEVEYDPSVVSYDKLLEIFWSIHDPTTRNRQGPDVGSQYRSVIFYYTPEQKAAAEASKKRLEASGRFKDPITTGIVPMEKFYEAEEYHQNYYEKHGMKPTCRFPPP